MRKWETAWLEYSRTIVTDTTHRNACAALGGSATGVDGVITDLRWPGYSGQHYKPGGLLWVNIVHADLRQKGCEATASTLIEATRGWRDGEVTDQEYLDANRNAYSVGLRRWTVASLIKVIATQGLGVDIEEMAYVNAARCQVIPGSPQHAKQDRLVGICQTWLPISAALKALRPSLVVTTSASVLRLAPLPDNVLVVGHHQRRGLGLLAGSPWKPSETDQRPWREQLAHAWRESQPR